MTNAIDLSHHNGSVDWHEVAKNIPVIDFAYLKCSQGVGYVDSALKHNSIEASMVNIPVGYYHYASLNSADVVTDAKAEANFFISQVKKLTPSTLPLVLDIEENKSDIPSPNVETWIHTFFITLESLGYNHYAIYSYTPFLNANLPANHSLGNIPLWIAAYVNKPQPVLPKGWTNYWLWQYSAKGKVSGINGDVDMNKSAS